MMGAQREDALPELPGQVDAVDLDTGARRTLTAFSGGGKRSSVLW
jgi:hypothetical protein